MIDFFQKECGGCLEGLGVFSLGCLFKCMVAEKKNSQAAAISVGGSVLYFMLSGFFQRFSGATGIGYAYMVTWVVVFIVSVIYLFTYNFIQSNQNFCD